MTNYISLVIPIRDDYNYISLLLTKVLEQETKPFEVLLVDSSLLQLLINEEIQESFNIAKIQLIHIRSKPLTPGAARNLGIQKAKCELIAFLDIKTLPPKNWLKEALYQIKTLNTIGVLGKTTYTASSQFEECVRAATFGVMPIQTIPGSLFKRDIFYVVGSFLENTIAGEDTDWIMRARLHGLHLDPSSQVSLSYTGLIGMKYPSLIKKWWRNYRACRNIPYLADHKSIYLLLLNLMLILIAMHWNSVIANWDESSSLYISHITKIGVLILGSIYIFYRSFYLPIRRGLSVSHLLPLKWTVVLFVALSIDIVKFVAFFPSSKTIIKRLRFAFFRE